MNAKRLPIRVHAYMLMKFINFSPRKSTPTKAKLLNLKVPQIKIPKITIPPITIPPITIPPIINPEKTTWKTENCSTRKAFPVGLPRCNSKAQLGKLSNITKELHEAHAEAIYKLTGCLSPCEKYEYHRIDTQMSTRVSKNSGQMRSLM